MKSHHWLKIISFIGLSVWSLQFSPISHAEDPAIQEITPFLPKAYQVGQGPFSYLGFKVYDAKYFVNDSEGKTGFAIRLEYARKVLGADLLKATMQQIARLGASENDIAKWEEELGKLYPNVDSGHQITAIYNPNGTTTFLHNGKLIGKMASELFSKYFFSIWLDPKTNRPELRRQLLGDLCSPSIISTSCIK